MQGGNPASEFKAQGAGRDDPLAAVDLTDPAIIAAPYPTYAAIQADRPVVWNNQLNGWLVTRYEDVDRLLRSPHTSVEKLQPFAAHSTASDRGNVELLADVLSDWMVFADPPHHTRLRRALKDAFMPAEIKTLEPRVAALVDELLADLPVDAPVDMVARFAGPLPSMVIGDLFGLPREELPVLKEWSDPLGRLVLASTERENLYANAGRAVRQMCARFQRLIDDHRSRPRENFTSRMLANAADLSDAEIVHSLALVLWAGHDTTTNHLATAIHYFCAEPALFQRLRREPALIPGAVEEFLRLDGPAHMLVRLLKEDIEVGGRPLKAGERVFLMMNTANRDPHRFDHADDTDPGRDKNRHLAFGKGLHVCLGAPLARLEGRLALTALCRKYRDIRFAGAPTWRPNLIMRGPDYLPVQMTRAMD